MPATHINNPRPMQIAGVVVTYHPPDGLLARLSGVLEQTDFVVVVDNGSSALLGLAALPQALRDRIHLISNTTNIGLAAALNQGISRSAELGASKALLLDHDSTPAPNLVTTLCAAETALGQDGGVAILVPAIRYARPDIECRWPSSIGHKGPFFHFVYARNLSKPTPVDLAIGSGMLINVNIWKRLGGFDESLFIDLVDTEFCLRARKQGLLVVAVPHVALQHELGHVTRRSLLGLPVFPTHHRAARHYYINRNRVVLARRYARQFPSWMVYELLGAFKLVLKTILFEEDRLNKIRHMLRGNLDGLRGRVGPLRAST